jgi:hypothetical protein
VRDLGHFADAMIVAVRHEQAQIYAGRAGLLSVCAKSSSLKQHRFNFRRARKQSNRQNTVALDGRFHPYQIAIALP